MKLVVGQESKASNPGRALGPRGWDQILQVLPSRLRQVLARLQPHQVRDLSEVRIRANRPLQIIVNGTCRFVGGSGELTTVDKALVPTGDECVEALHQMARWSIYALQQEMKNGYLTLPGGHRVGFTGEAVLEGEELKLIRHVTSLNIRLAREVLGKGLSVAEAMLADNGQLLNTLIIGPPNSGKTTLLRDLARVLGTGCPSRGLPIFQVAIIDERSEIAACHRGIPQFDVGVATDVLDRCPKAIGIQNILRAMAPEVIITDEIGRAEDVDAVYDAARSGVALVSSAHASGLEQAYTRPIVAKLLAENLFDQVVVLSRRQGPGTIEAITSVKERRGCRCDG